MTSFGAADVYGKERNSLSQMALGMWGNPFMRDGLALVKCGVIFLWSPKGNDTLLHFAAGGGTSIREEDWVVWRGHTLCGIEVKKDSQWEAVVAHVPQGFVAKRQLPHRAICRNCARWYVLMRRDQLAIDQLLAERPQAGTVHIEPIIHRSASTFGPLEEDPLFPDSLTTEAADLSDPAKDDA